MNDIVTPVLFCSDAISSILNSVNISMNSINPHKLNHTNQIRKKHKTQWEKPVKHWYYSIDVVFFYKKNPEKGSDSREAMSNAKRWTVMHAILIHLRPVTLTFTSNISLIELPNSSWWSTLWTHPLPCSLSLWLINITHHYDSSLWHESLTIALSSETVNESCQPVSCQIINWDRNGQQHHHNITISDTILRWNKTWLAP